MKIQEDDKTDANPHIENQISAAADAD